jgi:hypothetical protein
MPRVQRNPAGIYLTSAGRCSEKRGQLSPFPTSKRSSLISPNGKQAAVVLSDAKVRLDRLHKAIEKWVADVSRKLCVNRIPIMTNNPCVKQINNLIPRPFADRHRNPAPNDTKGTASYFRCDQ